MPWASTKYPSLALGTLVAAAQKHGFSCSAMYANLRFAAVFGVEPYEIMADTPGLFPLAEHLFAVDVFGKQALDSDAFLEKYRIFRESEVDSSKNPLVLVRDQIVPKFLDELTKSLMVATPDILGFTCTFNQVLPSLALARRVKSAIPTCRIVFGGACVHDRMGQAYASAFPQWIDHVFTGEADISFIEFLRKVMEKKEITHIPGVTVSGHLEAQAELVVDLDQAPAPNYDDYFAERNTFASSNPNLLPCLGLPFESARGCWWGAKHHCTFCGLNNLGMLYRSKSDAKVIGEITELSRRYDLLDFMAADNILNFTAYTNLLQDFSAMSADIQLFYEIKANVKRSDVAKLASARVRNVQPGVESFSDHVLKLMRKGVSALQNVQLLKLLTEYSINPIYNILVGFPDEVDDDYADMIHVIEAIRHLPPPSGLASIVAVHRFAPFHTSPEEYNIGAIRPAEYYRFLIPEEILPATDYAFFFERDLPDDAPVYRCLGRLNEAISAWKREKVTRIARLGCGFVEVITQYSPGTTPDIRILRGPEAVVFVLLDQQSALSQLFTKVEGRFSESVLAEATNTLIQEGLILSVGAKAISVVPFSQPQTASTLSTWLEQNAATLSSAIGLHGDQEFTTHSKYTIKALPIY